MSHYFSHTLSNGLRIVHLPTDAAISYCGIVVHAGTRDEAPNESGLAHFVEHMLFKGTARRKTWHILNRMEAVGGELNAYTTKEETFIYSVFMEEHYRRAIELLADIVIRSQFPAHEIEKEREVILDEIRSYEDMPSELIFDEYENLLFDGHPLGRHILGNKRSLRTFDTQAGRSFLERFYTAGNMIFFSMGRTDFRRIVRMAEAYLSEVPAHPAVHTRERPWSTTPQELRKKKKTHQSHAIIGGRAYDMYDKRRISLFLLNNILGGSGMNSRLNVALRERRGLVYDVESNLTGYTDTGVCAVYFGSDPKNREKVLELIRRELAVLCHTQLTTTQLAAAKKQAVGQLSVAGDNRESLFLGFGKSFLHFDRYDSLAEVIRRIEVVTASQILETANEIFAPEQLYSLIYE
ncbi:insulinase family protein [Tannerella forsythia]|uniref:Insulinase family protein n=2 Tax=Tannerella forsythia TaxID=28112 RepID=A0A3P1XW55_TANFO|nr:insulinase family protein [Tannerella forsythia]